MREVCTRIVDQIAEDREQLMKKMVFEADSNAVATLSAFMYAGVGKKADIDRYVECKKYFKKNVNVFSEMRGIAETIVITKMTLADDYGSYLEGVKTVYKKLRERHKLTASPYMVMAAINIYEAGGVEQADAIIDKFETVYKQMQASHPFLTDDEDRPFLSLMVTKNADLDRVTEEIDACYEASKKMSFSAEAMHTAAQVMSLNPKGVEEKVADLKDTMDALKANKVKGAKYELMPVVAALGLLPGTPESKAAEIKEISDYLQTKKGFKLLLDPAKRSMYATLVYAIASVEGDNTMATVVNTAITNIILDEIITMIIMISAAQSAARSANSN